MNQNQVIEELPNVVATLVDKLNLCNESALIGKPVFNEKRGVYDLHVRGKELKFIPLFTNEGLINLIDLVVKRSGDSVQARLTISLK